MRFTYAEAMTQASYYAPLAQAAEAAGYTSMTVADSLIYPESSDSKYPYTDTGDREFIDGKEFIETMVLCAHLFAHTTTLRLTPFVLKLPVRPPVLVAKQASSLAHLSGGRLGLGVGLSPWPEDFDALGVPWERRGKRMDECMDILKGLTTGEFFSYSGEFYEIESLKHANPTFHGDTIYSETEVLEVRESRSKPDRGIVKVKTIGYKQDGTIVCEFTRKVLIPKKDAAGEEFPGRPLPQTD